MIKNAYYLASMLAAATSSTHSRDEREERVERLFPGCPDGVTRQRNTVNAQVSGVLTGGTAPEIPCSQVCKSFAIGVGFANVC